MNTETETCYQVSLEIWEKIHQLMDTRSLRALRSTSNFFNQMSHYSYFRDYAEYMGSAYGVSNIPFKPTTDYLFEMKNAMEKAKAAGSILYKLFYTFYPLDQRNLLCEDGDLSFFQNALRITFQTVEEIKVLAPENNLLPVIRELLILAHSKDSWRQYFYFCPKKRPKRSQPETKDYLCIKFKGADSPINVLGISLLTFFILAGEFPCANFLLSQGGNLHHQNEMAGTDEKITVFDLVKISPEKARNQAIMDWLKTASSTTCSLNC